MSKIMILSNDHMYTYRLRKEVIQKFLSEGFEVTVVFPEGEKKFDLIEMGCSYIPLPLEGRSMNPLKDFSLFYSYLKTLKKESPDVVLTYTTKPNIYGGLAASIMNVPYIPNITGMGGTFINDNWLRKIMIFLYKRSMRNAHTIFFQNEESLRLFQKFEILKNRSKLIPGSGVNIEENPLELYPDENTEVNLLFVGRIMVEKGVSELFEAAKIIKDKYPFVNFDLVGPSNDNFHKEIDSLSKSGIINYHGMQEDVHSYFTKSHAIILPSYTEGTANVLLEAAATGRPIIASNVSGCKETFEEGKTGLGFEVKNVTALVSTIENFLSLSNTEKEKMGLLGREKIKKEFTREIVAKAYLDTIRDIMN